MTGPSSGASPEACCHWMQLNTAQFSTTNKKQSADSFSQIQSIPCKSKQSVRISEILKTKPTGTGNMPIHKFYTSLGLGLVTCTCYASDMMLCQPVYHTKLETLKQIVQILADGRARCHAVSCAWQILYYVRLHEVWHHKTGFDLVWTCPFLP